MNDDATTPTQVQLGPEDAARMRRLTEEVQGRLEEMALIAARAVGRTLERDAVRQFVPRRVPRAGMTAADEAAVLPPDAGDDLLYIEVTTNPDGSKACALHCPGHAVFVENPCGHGPIPCPPP